MTGVSDERLRELRDTDAGNFVGIDELAEICDELLRLRGVEKAAEGMAEALDMLCEGTECSFDHHGNCQEHGGWEEGIPCIDKYGLESLALYREASQAKKEG